MGRISLIQWRQNRCIEALWMCEWYFQLVGKTIQTKNHRSLKPRTSVHSLAILSFMVPFHVLFIFMYIWSYIVSYPNVCWLYCHLLQVSPRKAPKRCCPAWCMHHKDASQQWLRSKIWSSHPALLSLRLSKCIYIYIYIMYVIIMYTMYDD